MQSAGHGVGAIQHEHVHGFKINYINQPRIPKPDGRVRSKAVSSKHTSNEVPRIPASVRGHSRNWEGPDDLGTPQENS